MILILLVLILAVLLFGPDKIKAFAAGAMASGLLLFLLLADGASAFVLSRFWVWFIILVVAAISGVVIAVARANGATWNDALFGKPIKHRKRPAKGAVGNRHQRNKP
jgi:glycerol uptake facilitator-like aquaporin